MVLKARLTHISTISNLEVIRNCLKLSTGSMMLEMTGQVREKAKHSGA